jgi:hypothetical protein
MGSCRRLSSSVIKVAVIISGLDDYPSHPTFDSTSSISFSSKCFDNPLSLTLRPLAISRSLHRSTAWLDTFYSQTASSSVTLFDSLKVLDALCAANDYQLDALPICSTSSPARRLSTSSPVSSHKLQPPRPFGASWSVVTTCSHADICYPVARIVAICPCLRCERPKQLCPRVRDHWLRMQPPSRHKRRQQVSSMPQVLSDFHSESPGLVRLYVFLSRYPHPTTWTDSMALRRITTLATLLLDVDATEDARSPRGNVMLQLPRLLQSSFISHMVSSFA